METFYHPQHLGPSDNPGYLMPLREDTELYSLAASERCMGPGAIWRLARLR